jgi:hypothetical protein
VKALTRSLFASSAAISRSLVDQLLFGFSGFIVSWVAARELAATDLATFAIAWQCGLGIVAVASEAVVTPAVARFAGSRIESARFEAETVGTLCVWATGALLAAGALSAVSSDGAAVVAILAVGIAGSAFSLVRGMRYATGDLPGSIRRNLLRLAMTVGLLGAALGASAVSVPTALGTGAIAFLIPAAWRRWPRHGPRKLAAATRPFLAEAAWYTVATAVRMVGYAAGLILLVRAVRGADDAALVATLMILAGPTQIVSSSLPLLFLSELAAARNDSQRFRRALGEQFLRLVLVLVLGLVVAAAIYEWWVKTTVGDPQVQSELESAFLPFAVLVGGITAGSWISAAFKALRLPGTFTVVTSLSGLGSLAAVFTALNATWLAAVPYVIVTPVMVAVILNRLDDRTVRAG